MSQLLKAQLPSNNVCFGFKNRMRQWWCISLCQSQGHDHLVYMQFSILDGIAAGAAGLLLSQVFYCTIPSILYFGKPQLARLDSCSTSKELASSCGEKLLHMLLEI